MTDEITRVPLAELKQPDELEKHVRALASAAEEREDANEVLVLEHLVTILRSYGEDRLTIARMVARFEEVEGDLVNHKVATSVAYSAVVTEFRQLRERHQALEEHVGRGLRRLRTSIEDLQQRTKDLTEP